MMFILSVLSEEEKEEKNPLCSSTTWSVCIKLQCWSFSHHPLDSTTSSWFFFYFFISIHIHSSTDQISCTGLFCAMLRGGGGHTQHALGKRLAGQTRKQHLNIHVHTCRRSRCSTVSWSLLPDTQLWRPSSVTPCKYEHTLTVLF